MHIRSVRIGHVSHLTLDCIRAPFGIPTRCHVVVGDVKHAGGKAGVTHARPECTVGSHGSLHVRSSILSGIACNMRVCGRVQRVRHAWHTHPVSCGGWGRKTRWRQSECHVCTPYEYCGIQSSVKRERCLFQRDRV